MIESLSTMPDEFNWFLKILSAKVNAFALVFTSIIIAYSRYDMIGDSKPNRNQMVFEDTINGKKNRLV